MALTTHEKILVLALAASVMASVVILATSWRIKTVGRILAVGVEVFEDPACTRKCEAINWGVMRPGDLAGVTIYVKNTKNVDFTLSLNSTSWDPPGAAAYLSLTWNYSGAVVHPGEISPVLLTLQAATNITGVDAFSFDVLIMATEAP